MAHCAIDKLLFFGDLDKHAVLHNRNPVTQMRDDSQIMADKNVSELLTLPEVFQQVEDLRLDRHIEC